MSKTKQTLKVIYKIDERIDVNLDKVIEKFLKEQGYERWASGFDFTTRERDLCFDRVKKCPIKGSAK